MATPEALIKYYDCLRDSFNKIQIKDNTTALINAALRPKIRDEFAKSPDLLISYLHYIQIFSINYSEHFSDVCDEVIVPLFKEIQVETVNELYCSTESSTGNNAIKLHECIRRIIESKPELQEDLASCIVRIFPSISHSQEFNQRFKSYLIHSLKCCTLLNPQPIYMILSRIFDRLDIDQIDSGGDNDTNTINTLVDESFEIIRSSYNAFNESHQDLIGTCIIGLFARDFLSRTSLYDLRLLLLYIGSFAEKYSIYILTSLWDAFSDVTRPIRERQYAVLFASSFIARANYLDLEKVFEFLETCSTWCEDFLSEYEGRVTSDNANEEVQSFQAAAQAMMYLISQRYREMYEEESIKRLMKLNMNAIVNNQFRPLNYCDKMIVQRFYEVATLYSFDGIMESTDMDDKSSTKRRKSAVHPQILCDNKSLLEESFGDEIPSYLKKIYRNYYNHRNFTIVRE